MVCTAFLALLPVVALAGTPYSIPTCYKSLGDNCCDNGGKGFGDSTGGACYPRCTTSGNECASAQTYGSHKTPVCTPVGSTDHVCVLECGGDSDCFPHGRSGKGICSGGICLYPWDMILAVRGEWVHLGDSGGDTTWSKTVSEGVGHSHSDTTCGTWGQKVAGKLDAGFLWEKVEVSAEVSHQFARTHSDTFSETTLTSETHNFDAPGTAWQYVLHATEIGGISDIRLNGYAVTKGIYAPPCCLPGYWKDPSKPTGSCASGSPDICKGIAHTIDDDNDTLVV